MLENIIYTKAQLSRQGRVVRKDQWHDQVQRNKINAVMGGWHDRRMARLLVPADNHNEFHR